MAISVNDKNLGVVTAYGYAKSKGYTGTEEEFAALMASYADVAQEAETAQEAAEAAQAAAETAQGAAESARNTAQSAAGTATTKAQEASASATAASGSAAQAATSATAAAGSASAASGSATQAAASATAAAGSASDASDSADDAEAAQAAAESARDNITGMSVTATTLAAGSDATAAWDGESGTLSLGIPQGAKGDKGDPSNATHLAVALDPLSYKAPLFSASSSYAVGDYCMYTVGSGVYLYRFTAAHTGAWSDGDVEQITQLWTLGRNYNTSGNAVNSAKWMATTNPIPVNFYSCLEFTGNTSDGTYALTARVLQYAADGAFIVRSDLSDVDSLDLDPDCASIRFIFGRASTASGVPNASAADIDAYFSVEAYTTGEEIKDYIDDNIGSLESTQESTIERLAILEDYLNYGSTDVPGVQIDFENNRWTRIGAAAGLTPGADFDKFNAFGGRRRCNLADDGTVNAYYGDSGYIEDGSNGQVMVEQPKFYYRVVPLKLSKQAVGNGYDILKANYYVSDVPRKGFKLHPAFINEAGEEVSVVYIGAAKACLYDVSASEYNLTDAQTMEVAEDKLSSIFGAKPASGLTQQFTRPNIETMANNRGAGWHGESSKVAMATFLLMFIEGADNLQTVFGSGVSSIPDNVSYNCSSITGSTASLGNASGRAASTVNETNGTETTYTADGKVSISYRGEEDPYGNQWEFFHDVNVWGNGSMQGGEAFISTDFNYAESKRTDNYAGCGWCFPASSGYIKYLGYGNRDYDWLLAPSSNGGSSLLPLGDYDYVTANLDSFRIASFGGSWSSGAFCGLGWRVFSAVGSRHRSFGARLVKYPQTTV